MTRVVLVYFWFNVVAYALFAVWCTVAPHGTARFLGFTLEGAKGEAEYVAVYGGIEAAFAVFFALCALRPAWHGPGLTFAVCLYGGLVLFRSIVLVRNGLSIGTAIYPYVFEVVMLVVAIVLLRRQGV